ncbi:hypothetical protein KRP22_010974 [Phytophthora ramorum]|nr:Glutathione S-transferase 1 [Phytophthora ramorum]
MANTGTVRLIAPRGLNAVRLALCIGNVAFEDSELPSTDEAYPELLVNGESFTQPQSMLRYAGRLSGSYPATSPLAALQVDEILHVLSEVEAKMKYPEEESASDDQVRLRKELGTLTFPRYASLIEARLEHLRSVPVLDFFGERVLVHEIAVYCWVKVIRQMGLGDEISRYPCVLAAESKVESHPRINQLKKEQSSCDHPKLKLTYFPFPGRAEPIRLALFIGGVAFEDERIGFDDFNRRRSLLPFNQLPVLEVDGEVISQALAILRYAGTLAGLYSPTNTREAFRIDEVFSLVDDFYNSYTWNASYFMKDPAKQLELRASLANKTLPRTLGFLERRVVEWNGCHAVGDKFTAADLAIYSLLWTFRSGRILGVPVSVVTPYEKLLCIYQTVASHAKVVEWTAMQH